MCVIIIAGQFPPLQTHHRHRQQMTPMVQTHPTPPAEETRLPTTINDDDRVCVRVCMFVCACVSTSVAKELLQFRPAPCQTSSETEMLLQANVRNASI